MRSRISLLVLGFVLIVGLMACSKKDQSQNQNPPATTDTSAANQPATTTAPATVSTINLQNVHKDALVKGE